MHLTTALAQTKEDIIYLADGGLDSYKGPLKTLAGKEGPYAKLWETNLAGLLIAAQRQ